jgi:uncharacterized protein (TIGR03435 family)
MRYMNWSLLLLFVAVRVAAQSSATAFDVASVRPSAGEPVGASFKTEGGRRFIADGATLRDLISRAYSVQDFQIVTTEAWMSNSRFDVDGRVGETPLTDRSLNMMLQALLGDRFGLRLRDQTNPGPIYTLTVDGPLGPGMQASAMDCSHINEGRDLFDGSPVEAGSESCQPRTRFVAGAKGARITFTRPGITTTQIATLLTPFARRTVVDKTGLQGTFDVQLTVSPESSVMVTPDRTVVAQQAEGLSLATAVREQLGLRLRSAEGPTKTLVVERANPPAAD